MRPSLRNNVRLACLPMLLFTSMVFAQTVKVHYISFLPTEQIQANPVKEFDQEGSNASLKDKVVVFPQLRFQTITGMGGCFNENGGEALLSLPKNKQQEIMRNLFDAQSGCGFTFCRTAIGSSDFGLDAYSYSEVAGDFKMEHFSVKRDEQFVLPYIKSALDINPALQLFASPWSPPAWMKKSGKMVGVNPDNVLNGTKEIYQAYALYFVKYIEAYSKQGVTIHRIHPQNETDMNSNYPSCIMPPAEMNSLVMNYLNPAFKRSNIKAEIWAGTYRTYGKLEALELFADPKFRNKVSGVGLQYTKPIHLNDFRALYPKVKMMHTEGKCYNGDNSMKQAQARWTEISDYLNAGVENYAYWNMILNETGKSGWNWKQNALINIDRNTGSVTYNPDYAVMFLVSKFIRPGDVRIAHFTTSETPVLVLVDKTGKHKLMVQNDAETDKVLTVEIENRQFQVRIPALALSAVEF